MIEDFSQLNKTIGNIVNEIKWMKEEKTHTENETNSSLYF